MTSKLKIMNLEPVNASQYSLLLPSPYAPTLLLHPFLKYFKKYLGSIQPSH